VSDRWLKPDFQEIGVGGECTAYAGTQEACETNSLSAAVCSPLSAFHQRQERRAESGQRTADGG